MSIRPVSRILWSLMVVLAVASCSGDNSVSPAAGQSGTDNVASTADTSLAAFRWRRPHPAPVIPPATPDAGPVSPPATPDAGPVLPPTPPDAAPAGPDAVVNRPDAGPSPDSAVFVPDTAATARDAATPDLAPASKPDTGGVEAARALGNARSTMGYNLDFPGDWSNLSPFIDLMKGARAWNGGCAGTDDVDGDKHLNLDAAGWPRSLTYFDDPAKAYCNISTYFSCSMTPPDAGKAFLVTWDGSGDLDIFNGANVVKDLANRRITFTLQGDNSSLRITKTDPADYVRNIKMIRADRAGLAASGELFNPDALAYLAPFGSVRFMDWMLSNNPGTCRGGSNDGTACYPVSNESCAGGTCVVAGKWSERPTADQAFWGSWAQYRDNRTPALGTKEGGYPVEVMVALANRLGADPHFNLPAAYDDDYVKQFARYVRANLAPNLRASFEYSNEVWNWGFPQAGYANVQGRKLWPSLGEAWVEFMASRTQNMCGILKAEFAGQTQRIRCLISPQTGWPDLGQTVLDCPDWVKLHPELGSSCHQDADAIAITGYFGGCLQDNEATVLGWITSQGHDAAIATALAQLQHGSSNLKDSDGAACSGTVDGAVANYSFWKGLATARGKEIYVYEGGTEICPSSNTTMRQFLVDLSHSPGMYDVYKANYTGYKAAGGTIFNVWGWINPNDWWANADSLFDTSHPKYRAIVDFARGNPCGWANCDRSTR